MSDKPTELITILIASPSAEERKELIKFVGQAETSGKLWAKSRIMQAESPGKAKQHLSDPGIDLCLLGAALGEDEQDFLVRAVARRLKPGTTVMVPILERGDQQTLMRFIQAGARGILLQPVSPESFLEVLRNAIDVRPQAQPSREEVASLPWVLEHVAQRLTELAERVREEEGPTPIGANAKLIKEALLGVIGTSSTDQEQSIMRLAEHLAKGQK